MDFFRFFVAFGTMDLDMVLVVSHTCPMKYIELKNHFRHPSSVTAERDCFGLQSLYVRFQIGHQ